MPAACQLSWPSTLQVFIDTTGWAFTYPLARLAGARVACYTHYPTVSTNMLQRVWSRKAMYNNNDQVAGRKRHGVTVLSGQPITQLRI